LFDIPLRVIQKSTVALKNYTATALTWFITHHTQEKKKVISSSDSSLWNPFYEKLFCLQIYLSKEQIQHYILWYPPKFWATNKSQDENLSATALVKVYSFFLYL